MLIRQLLLLQIVLVLFAQVAIADFHDQNFVYAKVRTDYNSQTEGQTSNPVTFISPCLFPGQPCGTGPTTYDSTNSYMQNTSSWPSSSFWVLSINNENSYDIDCPPPADCSTYNPGPPNQSVARSTPGYGLMGFTAIKNSIPGESFYRAHMVMNGTFPNPAFGGIPFLAIGADELRGNGGPIGKMNTVFGKHNVEFKARLWDFKLPTAVSQYQPPTLAFYVLAMSSWNGKKRGVFLALAHWNLENSTASTAATLDWNWPMQESFYHPGAEFFYIDAEDVYGHCGFTVPELTTINQQITYAIDIEALFSCADDLGGFSDAMPSGAVDIEGIHWPVEMTGKDGWLWTSVHDMEMTN